MCLRMFEICDPVVLEVVDEKRRTFAIHEDGPIEAIIIGFGKTYVGRVNNDGMIPGCYHNRRKVRVSTGYINCLLDRNDPGVKIHHADPVTASERVDTICQEVICCNCSVHDLQLCQRDYHGSLPATKFWEGDRVKVSDKAYTVVGIDYRNAVTSAGSYNPYTQYYLADDLYQRHHTLSVYGSDLILDDHGPIRRFVEGWPLQFGSIEQEVDFHRLMGNYRRVARPNHNSRWNVDNLLDALESGMVHHAKIYPADGQFHIEDPIWLYDEPIGQRIAQALTSKVKKLAIA